MHYKNVLLLTAILSVFLSSCSGKSSDSQGNSTVSSVSPSNQSDNLSVSAADIKSAKIIGVIYSTEPYETSKAAQINSYSGGLTNPLISNEKSITGNLLPQENLIEASFTGYASDNGFILLCSCKNPADNNFYVKEIQFSEGNKYVFPSGKYISADFKLYDKNNKDITKIQLKSLESANINDTKDSIFNILITALAEKRAHKKNPADVEADKPTVDQTIVDKPTVDKPTVDKPTVDKPTVDKPTVDKPTVDKPTVDITTVDQTIVDKPTVDITTVDQTRVDTSTTDKAAADKAAADKAAADKAVADKAAADKAAADKAAADKAAADKAANEDAADDYVNGKQPINYGLKPSPIGHNNNNTPSLDDIEKLQDQQKADAQAKADAIDVQKIYNFGARSNQIKKAYVTLPNNKGKFEFYYTVNDADVRICGLRPDLKNKYVSKILEKQLFGDSSNQIAYAETIGSPKITTRAFSNAITPKYIDTLKEEPSLNYLKVQSVSETNTSGIKSDNELDACLSTCYTIDYSKDVRNQNNICGLGTLLPPDAENSSNTSSSSTGVNPTTPTNPTLTNPTPTNPTPTNPTPTDPTPTDPTPTDPTPTDPTPTNPTPTHPIYPKIPPGGGCSHASRCRIGGEYTGGDPIIRRIPSEELK